MTVLLRSLTRVKDLNTNRNTNFLLTVRRNISHSESTLTCSRGSAAKKFCTPLVSFALTNYTLRPKVCTADMPFLVWGSFFMVWAKLLIVLTKSIHLNAAAYNSDVLDNCDFPSFCQQLVFVSLLVQHGSSGARGLV